MASSILGLSFRYEKLITTCKKPTRIALSGLSRRRHHHYSTAAMKVRVSGTLTLQAYMELQTGMLLEDHSTGSTQDVLDFHLQRLSHPRVRLKRQRAQCSILLTIALKRTVHTRYRTSTTQLCHLGPPRHVFSNVLWSRYRPATVG